MFSSYLKIALKVLRRRKFFTFVSLFGIGFTLAILMIVSAVFDDLLGAHAPESKRDRTLVLYDMMMRGPTGSASSSSGYSFLERYARDLPGVVDLSIVSDDQAVLSYRDGKKIESTLKRTDGAFWRIFEFEFLEGAAFTDEDESAGNHVAVINETTRERFFDDGPAVGRDVTFDAQRFRVVGVVADVAMTRQLPFSEIWVPISTSKSTSYRHQFLGGFRAIVLAESRSDFAEIKETFRARLREVEMPDPASYDTVEASFETVVENVARHMFGAPRHESKTTLFTVTLVLGMVLFMVLPTLNLVNLNLSRIMERSSEIGVRKSFGASSGTLVGQFVVENIVLTLIGGVLGLALSAVGLRILNEIQLIPYSQFGLNLRVFGYGLLLALFFGLLSGVYPAWRMSRLHPVEALRGRPS